MPGFKALHVSISQLLVMISITLLACSSATAAEASHSPLTKSERFSIAEVFSNAVEHAPEMLSSPARQDQASQYSKVGNSMIVGNPSLQGSYIDDRVLDSVGLREIEARLQISLWRPGQRQQAQILGDRYQYLNESWRLNLRWEVAGRVRQVLAELQRAETMLQLRQQAIASTEQLHQLTEALYLNGSVAQLDVMQSEALLLQQQGLLFNAEAALIDAELNYTMLTGLSVRPATAYSEAQSEHAEIAQDHPLLQYLQANIDVADSQVERIRRQANGSPLLGFGVRRERGSRQQEYIDSLGLSLNIPVGKSPVAAAQISDARRQQADLLVARQQAYRQLNRDLQEASHLIELTDQQLGLTEAQFNLSQQRSTIARSAFELGETDLLQAVLALQQAQAAEQELRSLELRRQSLIIEYNHTLGILP